MIETISWEDFLLDKLFEIKAGKYHSSEEYENGNTPYVSASAINNAISERINLEYDFKGNVIITGKVGCTAFYQKENFCATSDVNIFIAKNFEMNYKIGLFIVTIINFSENYKWGYGRQCRVNDSKKIIIKLPIQMDRNNSPIIDKNKLYSENGYIPDWQFMEKYIENLEKQEKNNIKNLIGKFD
jgi:hypothetical protein